MSLIDSFYAHHRELCRLKKDPASIPKLRLKRNLYHRYYVLYSNAAVDEVRDAVISAISQGETSYIIYDEDTISTGLNADDLEEIFKVGVDQQPSIQSLFYDKVGDVQFSIQCRRAAGRANTNRCDTTVRVQFVLTWTKPVEEHK